MCYQMTLTSDYYFIMCAVTNLFIVHTKSRQTKSIECHSDDNSQTIFQAFGIQGHACRIHIQNGLMTHFCPTVFGNSFHWTPSIKTVMPRQYQKCIKCVYFTKYKQRKCLPNECNEKKKPFIALIWSSSSVI